MPVQPLAGYTNRVIPEPAESAPPVAPPVAPVMHRLYLRPLRPAGLDLSLPELPAALARWRPLLLAYRLDAPAASRLALWLPEAVEAEVDAAMARSPGLGLALDSLAGGLLMAALAELAPDAARFGCAPLPPPESASDATLAAAGLARLASGALSRRYAVLTFHPYRPGCRACLLRAGCPRREPDPPEARPR